jgi:hypothetical protein
MPKGEKLRPKQNGSANHLRIFENNRVRIYDLLCLLWGRILIMGKGGVFCHLINFTLGISLDVPK